MIYEKFKITGATSRPILIIGTFRDSPNGTPHILKSPYSGHTRSPGQGPLGLQCRRMGILDGELCSWPVFNPKALRTHILRFLGPKTMLCSVLGSF